MLTFVLYAVENAIFVAQRIKDKHLFVILDKSGKKSKRK